MVVQDPIKHYRKRFIYHFVMSPKTSLVGKPEWYLNTILKWIDEVNISLRHQFMLAMLELAHMRLSKDIKAIDKPQLQVHTYNEVISFVKIIKRHVGDDRYQELNGQHDLMAVFSESKLFEAIIDIEWDYSTKNINSIIRSDDRWDTILNDNFVDRYRIPKCVDRFLLQIKSIEERVECFKQIDCQYQLIDLQLGLFSKFHKFLKSSLTCNESLDKSIFTSGVDYLHVLLRDKLFIPESIRHQLDKTLRDKLNKLEQGYRLLQAKLL